MTRSVIGVSRFRFFVDRPEVRRRVGRKQISVLTRTGAYGRGAMKKSIRPPLKQKKLRTIEMPVQYINRQGIRFTKVLRLFVPKNGPRIIDLHTGENARMSAQEAALARELVSRRVKGQGEGRPPRRGPTDKLRKNIDFGIDPQTESVVIGAVPFPDQPRLVGRVTVPELLDKGGGEYLSNQLVKYGERPFTKPILSIARRKMGELLEKVPL